MTTLIEELDKKLDAIANTDPNWVHFINDHRQYIIDNSDILTINDDQRDRYRYKLDHFLRDNLVSMSANWIIKLINDISLEEDFALKSRLHIPDFTIISNLYRQYRLLKNATD